MENTKQIGGMNAPDIKKGKLPLAFVMWLTIRSQFLDKLIHKDPNLSAEWNQFEVDKLEELKSQIPQPFDLPPSMFPPPTFNEETGEWSDEKEELFAHGGNDHGKGGE